MKGYPKSKFEIVNQSQITNIETVTPTDPIPLVMATYTSDKGNEDWEVLTSFNDFTKNHGGLNFARHGQAQLTVIEALRNGAYVLAKRLVSDNATLANNSIRARVRKVGDVSYVYLYSKSVGSVATADEVYDAILGDFDYDTTAYTEITIPIPTTPETEIDTLVEGDEPDKGTTEGQEQEPVIDDTGIKAYEIDIPLFTIVATGRGESNISFRLVPEYIASKSNSYLKYSVEVVEDSTVLDSVVCSLNPDVIYDNANQSLDTKVNAVSKNVTAKLYETAIYKLASILSETAKIGTEPVSVTDLMNMDMLNGLDRKGKVIIGGVVTESGDVTDGSSLWSQYIPADIQANLVNLQGEVGVNLPNGSYGSLGFDPSKNPAELESLLLGAWGAAGTTHPQFDPIIYDLDKYKIDVVFDANFPMPVKNAIINVLDFRGDAVFLADLGTDNLTTLDAIIKKKNGDDAQPGVPGIQYSKFVTVYHNYFKIISSYNNKQIEVTMPYLLISRLLAQFDNGLGRPFAGIANQLTFPEIITKSVNFLPVVIPGEDQKQRLVDENINYISYYDETAVMETMYTNDNEYSQLSFLHNILSIQEVVKALRTRCPKIRYTFIDGTDLDKYIDDCNEVINNYRSNFKSIEMTYMQDEKYEQNNIFYAAIKVTFKKFVQEEYFKIIALS